MQGATPGFFQAYTQFKNDPHPPASSFTSGLNTTTPAKRITFYKSGDIQFKGVKMAIHKRSFKCFDAILDDLSQKVPLPFGVRTITTPRGTHSIKHLEQLEDGGCYLCSDGRYVKPIDIEAAGKRPTVWNHSHPHNAGRKPSRPEDAPSGHRHPKRIVLVKNADPAVRRSVLLSRRTARSLRVFMDEISELMQCHVKKLYTLEGRKIDSIQSLMQGPSVLVCVGREPFRPLLTENLRKLSDERLPGMGTRSRSSICSEGHESKKNVNFGLETKKSIIHPRSDSSNRSTRFSLSSEKSYQNGLCMTPGQSACVSTCPYVKEISMIDDIKKRVLVNKDGSLSVEMRVRFRLFNDETLQWSTEIKKSSTKLTDSGSENTQHYLQAKAECSEPDSISPSENEEAFATKLHKKHLEDSLRQNCCNHCQEYDIWKNPLHKDSGVCKSPSSSGSSHKIVCKKTSVDSTHTISRSSEEYNEHVVEKASCFQQTVAEGDTRVEYCVRSRCCSRSEVSASKSKMSCEDGCEGSAKNKCCYGGIREPDAELSPTPHYEVTEERAISAVSSSSKVLECLKDDQDDEYDDLPPSISRALKWSQSDHLEGDAQSKCIHCCGCQTSPRSHLSPRPPSKVSSCAVRSLRSKKYKTTLVDHTARTTSAVSNVSSRSPVCDCEAKTPSSPASGRQCRAKKGARSIISRCSRASKSEGQINTPALEIFEDEKVQENGCVSAMSVKSSVFSWCGECKGLMNPKETELHAEKDGSATSQDAQEKCKTLNNYKSDGERSETAQSKHSNASNNSKRSNRIAHEKSPEVETAEEKAKSGMSTKSASAESTKSKPNCIISNREPTPISLSEAKSDSATSNKSNLSCECRPLASEETKISVKTCCKVLETKATEDSSSTDVQCDHEEKSNASSKHSHMQKRDCNVTECNERVPSAMSVKTNTSSSSCRSRKSNHNLPETIVTSVPEKTDECETPDIVLKRANSAMSQTSAIPERSINPTTPDAPASQEMKAEENDKHKTQNALTVTSPSPRRSPSSSRTKSTKTDVKECNGRATSGMSVNSKVSSRSQRSSKCHSSSGSHLGESKTQKEGAKDEPERVLSRSSGKSHLSVQSHLNNTQSLCSQLDEPLSPTSTASVSLGLPEEPKCDDFEGQSTSDITEDCGCKLEVVNGQDVEERPKTAVYVTSQISGKSPHMTCKTPVQTLSPVSAEKVSNNIRSSSALSASSSRSKSPGSAKTTTIKVHETIQAEMTEPDKTSNKISSKSHHNNERASRQTVPASDCLSSSKVSECSEMSKREASKHSSKCNGLNICDEDNGSLKTSKSCKRSVKEHSSKPNSVVMSDISQKCRSLPQEKQSKHKASIINPDSSDSVLSQTLSAADLLRELVANARPLSRESKSVASSKNIDKVGKIKDSKSEKSSRSEHRKISTEHNRDEQYSIMPSCLPNASPTEVVNDWLMNNPIDGPAYEMDIEFIENTEIQGEEEALGDKSEAAGNITKVKEPHEEQTENRIEIESNVNCETQSCDERSQVELDSKKESLDKQCPSVQVMKVLLGPKLNRCRSLPEVSPVYGRKLSRSAQGLLDCLANLQLIESDPKKEKDPKYNEVITILQSLWLQKPSEDELNKQTKTEHQSGENEFNLQSSSGVDVSSGSTWSVKGSTSGIVEKSETAHSKISPIPELEASNKDIDETLMEDMKTAASCDETSNILDPTTPDIAERVQGSPEIEDVNDSQEKRLKTKEESDQTQKTSSNKSSGNDMMKSSENTSSGSPPSVQRAPLAKRISQDPDPVWVLSLLKKLEKQFMVHYGDAMAEFKVKWDLDDNEMLNTMISELKGEVHKRIQSSINRELQKIQSRAGRGPRPPGNPLSSESTAQTEQRRRRLRVMCNKSITFSRSEENFTASGTENSDQRSDDEYCPCDACMKRKMASRGVQRAEALSLAPIKMEFDLRKILQMKKDPVKPAERKVKDQNTAIGPGTGEDNNLEVLHEEMEKVNGNVRGCNNEDVEEDDNEETNDKGNSQDVYEDHETKDEECDENDGVDVEEEKSQIQEDAEKDENVEKKDEDISEVEIVQNGVDAEEIEKDMETTEKTKETDEETESHVEEKAPEDEAEEAKNGEDQPATDGESNSNKDNLSESNDDETEKQNEKNDDGNQTESPEDEAEKDEEVEEDQLTTSRVNVKVEVKQDLENENDTHNSTEEALTEDTERDKSAESSGVDSEMTRTSMESQPGSMENCTNQTVQAKLHDLQSFMQSIESQGDSVVVITKQPLYKENDGLHGRDDQKNISNGVMGWQISPKIKTGPVGQRK